MADNKKSVNFLPEYLRTDKNSKFLSSTLDPLIQTPQVERIDGFVGSKISPNYDPTVDTYINEDSSLRKNYSLEPALIFRDNNSKITDVVSYDDLINEIEIQGGKVDNLDKLFKASAYSYDPYIDWDKLVNYSQYYWLPFGPEAILIDEVINVDTYIQGQENYSMTNGYNLSNGMKIKFSSKVTPPLYQENEYIVEGVGDSIKLILVELLTSNEKITSIYNETFDNSPLDVYPFDGSSRLPLTPEYVTINKSSDDLNSWSRYNRWFHGEVIRITSEINNLALIYPLESRAKRPIIEFKPNIQLYNFGTTGIKNVDHIDTDTIDAFITVDGSAGYYIDGVLISKGDRVIFNADRHPDVRGKIYQVGYDIVDNSITVRLEEVHTSSNLESISVNYGTVNQGTSWHFDESNVVWVLSQQHTVINQAPLFNLFDLNGDSCSNNSTFVGSKIFGYDIGTGTADSVLGFPLKYKNSVGVGSYLFKNYFMYDTFDVTENNKSRQESTSIFYFKVNGLPANVWQPAVDYQTPVIETTVVSETTSSIQLKSFDTSVDALSVTTFVNNFLTSSTVRLSTLTSALIMEFDKPLKVNDFVSFEIVADYVPNNNGFYKTPLGLTNNPLNGPIASLTLSELSDHLMTMIRKNDKFSGVFPGVSNLRDISDYSKYGTRLIINASPISFAHIFLGKKEHNVVDAIRHAGDRYNQFKMNLLRIITEVPGDISPSDALDIVLKEINRDKDYRSSYYRSDMLGYGDNKIVRVKIADGNTTEYAIGHDFDITTSTFESVLVYVNDEQQVLGKDYNFSSIDTIVFLRSLSHNEVISIVYYPDTLGSFIPATPTKLGLYPAYEPALTTDYSLISLTTTNIIIGHDGSIMRAYDDYRDYIILEYETRIYNNLKVPYNSELFDLNAVVPGVHRNSRYSLDDFTNLITKDFVKWTGLYNIDANANDLYDSGNPLTWNYNGNINLEATASADKNSSMVFGGSYLSIAPSTALDFGTSDFTIEAWIYVTTVGTPGIRTIISSVFGSGGLQYGIGFITGSEEEFIDPNYVVYYADAHIENNKWYHVAMSRVLGFLRIYIDGTILGSAIKPEPMSLCANGYNTLIGTAIDYGNGTLGGAFFGNISNLRVVKGTAVYTEPFTPPTFKLTVTQLANQNGYPSAAISDPTQTSLLTLQDSYIVDNSIYNHQISEAGTVGVSLDNVPFGTKSFSVSGKNIQGFWKGIYKYLYDTDRPDTHPWEMLGHSNKPTWWDTYYSWTDLDKRGALILAIVNGYTKQPLTILEADLNYVRPDFESYLPVDRFGNLLTPSLNSVIGDTDKQANWAFGDQGPVEISWRKSSYWPFVLNAAAALLDPCRYTSYMYDVSNTYIGFRNQISYLQNIYLNPKNLLIDGNNNERASGFGVYVVEKGKEKNKDYISSLKEDISNINFNLFHKFGGFASKDKLQVVVDSIDPVSQSQGVLLPPEDYSILLNVSNPIKSASISGVIVQKFGGSFIVKGYNKTNPYFEILTTIKFASAGSLTVGGKSSPFTEWSSQTGTGLALNNTDATSAESNTKKYYSQGQIVRYNGRYYTVKAGHAAQSTFDSSLFYPLTELPMKGGSTVQLPSQFSNTVVQVPYGTVYSSIQEVYDMLVGYGAYLEKQGFIFDELNSDLNEIMDWKFTGKEFLYWTTQNWADGHLITLSPFANYLKYSFPDSIVDNISTGKYEYSLLKADGKSFPIDKFRLSREDGTCIITTINTLEGMFFATLNSIQKEHAMVFNNTTIFNDTIYDIETGYKQQRMKFSGFRTANWNGDLSSPGFVYDQVDITDWKPYSTYLPGVVVRYIGSYYESSVKIINDATFDFAKWDKLSSMPESNLLPNFDYKISQFDDFYSLDIDNFDSSQQELAQHLVGYTPRNYLNNIFVNPISQYKFYQGYIREKGTKNALSKLEKVSRFTRQGEITLTEDWAFRIGEYGSFSTYNEIEFNLTEGDALENPYVVKLVDSIPKNSNPLINYVDSLLITPSDYIPLSTFITYPGTFSENNINLPTAGYVRLDDVTATAYNKNSLLDIANNSILQEGHSIWLGFLENGGWTVYRYAKQSAKIAGVYVESPGTSITFSTDIGHNLSVGEIVSIVNFNTQVNGIYIVTNIPNLDRFTVASTLTSITDDDLLSLGLLFKFEDVRYDNAYQLSNIKDIVKKKYGEKIWIDQGADEKWKVYEKTNNYSTVFGNFETLNSPLGQKLGQAIYSTPDSNLVLTSAPGLPVHGSPGVGSIWVYAKNPITDEISKQFEYGLSSINATYCDLNYIPNFGFSLSYDDNKNLYFAGAPAASYVRGPASPTGVVALSTGSGNIRSYMEEGLVKISRKSPSFNKELTEAVLLNPYPESNSNFGYSVYVGSTSTTAPTTLLVGAPGSGTGKVYAYSITSSSNINILAHSHGITLNSHVSLTSKSRFGHKIAGDIEGNVIAISAPDHHNTLTFYTGIVQLFNRNLNWIQTLTSPFGTYHSFGDDVTVSPDGSYIFVSSINTKVTGEPYGKVAVYKFNGTVATLHQIISNPIRYNNLKFGVAISISEDNSTLAISALGINSSNKTRFDSSSKSGETIFDGKTTRFNDSIDDSGVVYVFEDLEGYFVPVEELTDYSIPTAGKFGTSIAATNIRILVGSPSLAVVGYDASTVYQFDKVDTSIAGWKLSSTQEDLVDVSTINRVVLIDNFKEEVIEYIDVIDPLKGKIAGIAEQELKYKSAFDPAIYSIGLAASIVDSSSSWIDEHVGELWWDLSNTKYIWYEQGDEIFRKNNWGKLFPGSSIDVYEWVKSDLLPSEWAAQADTTSGLTKGISGQPKYPDNSNVSVKQLFNNVTNSFENVYYFWVKNKVTVPNTKNRRISSYQVSRLIADPSANGLKFVEILSADSLAFSNVQPLLIGSRINANIAMDNTKNDIPRHTEWVLLSEGDYHNDIHPLLEKKLFDSLVGHDLLGNSVPDTQLTYRNRYGIGIRPQQTLFKDRSAALKNLIEFANSVLIKNRITDNYSFDNLQKEDPIPDIYSKEYDLIVETTTDINDIDTRLFERAIVSCTVNNGKIDSVSIVEPGFGYTNAPLVTVVGDETGASIVLTINTNGSVVSASIENYGSRFVSSPQLLVRPHTVIVSHDELHQGRWTKHIFDYNTSWIRVENQTYNTSLYWNYVNWTSDDYIAFKDYNFVVAQPIDISSLVDVQVGDYVKVNNVGNGNYVILKKIASDKIGNFSLEYDIVFKEKGTIQISDLLWNYNSLHFLYDTSTIDETLYDQIPDMEIFYILTALRDDIFINELKVYWNKFFFAAVKYALIEQKLLDWAFKTSFINVTNQMGELDQRPVYKLDNEKYFEEYVKEVKPYHSNIRNYISKYTYIDDAVNFYSTDFDLPPYYNQQTSSFDVINTNTLTNTLLNQEPWKSWNDNYQSVIGSIIVADAGSGYSEQPTISIIGGGEYVTKIATAIAYIRNGSVYKIVVTDPGSGYTMMPRVSISGGGYFVSRVASASAILSNSTIRKNTIGIKFNRVDSQSEIGDVNVTDTFICTGQDNSFVLSWLADTNKSNIIPVLDGKLILSTEYTIEYYKETYNGYSKKYSKFVFLDIVPKKYQYFVISYKKSIELYTAADMINTLYTGTSAISELMTGTVYPAKVVQGLPFNYSPAYGYGKYDDAGSVWSNIVDEYASAKIIANVNVGDTILYLNTLTNIIPGQVINVLNSPDKRVRNDTVVVHVDTATTSITISQPRFSIRSYKTTSTTIGTSMVIRTRDEFNGGIVAGDSVFIPLGDDGGDWYSVNGNNYPGTGADSWSGFMNNYAIWHKGNFDVNTFFCSTVTNFQVTGDYTFNLSADNAAQVFLDGVLVSNLYNSNNSVDTNNYSGNPASSVTVPVYSGPHTILIQSSNYGGPAGVALQIQDVDGNEIWNTRLGVIAVPNPSEFGGRFIVDSVIDVDKFTITSNKELTTTTQYFNLYKTVSVDTIIKTINAGSVLLDHITGTFIPRVNYNTIDINLGIPFSDITNSVISKSGIVLSSTPTSAEYYILSKNTSNGNTILNFYNMVALTYDLDISIYGDPVIELWKTDKTVLSTTSTITSNFTSTFTPADPYIYHDGDVFLNERSGYAPEELVAGTVLDSVGINVYTKANESYATAFSGSLMLEARTSLPAVFYVHKLNLLENDLAITMVHYNGDVLTRVANLSEITSSSQYYMVGYDIHIPPQSEAGILGYTAMSIGGDYSVLDSNIITVENYTVSTAVVESLAIYADVHQAYVLLDGVEVSEGGYNITAVSGSNNRACVNVFNVSTGTHTIEAWFFESKYTKFNRIHEEVVYSTVTNNTFTLSVTPGTAEPVSAQVMVTIDGVRLTPPWVSYYKVTNNQRVFTIEGKNTYDPNVFNSSNTFVYVNGVALRFNYEYVVNSEDATVIIVNGLLRNGDAVAIMSLYVDNIYGRPNHEYVINGNVLTLVTAVPAYTNIKVLTFTDHDNVMIRTENFDGNPYRRFTLDLPIRNDNYLWVYVNGKQLSSRYEFEILENSKTIQISDLIPLTTEDTVTITTINPPSYGMEILGFRMFKDMFGRDDYKRLSEFYSTSLMDELYYDSTEIKVKDASRLISPNPSINRPGVVLIDGERIEYFRKDGNILKELRRGTLGTGRPAGSAVGTKVIDQSQSQVLPDLVELTLVQTTATTTTTYTINTITNSITGDGITFIDGVDPVDQVSVYYGGRHLRKSALAYHDKNIAYDPTVNSVTILPPEFTINSATGELVLNISDINGIDTTIEIVQRKGQIWTGTNGISLISSTATQAVFMRDKVAILPDIHYYGGYLLTLG